SPFPPTTRWGRQPNTPPDLIRRDRPAVHDAASSADDSDAVLVGVARIRYEPDLHGACAHRAVREIEIPGGSRYRPGFGLLGRVGVQCHRTLDVLAGRGRAVGSERLGNLTPCAGTANVDRHELLPLSDVYFLSPSGSTATRRNEAAPWWTYTPSPPRIGSSGGCARSGSVRSIKKPLCASPKTLAQGTRPLPSEPSSQRASIFSGVTLTASLRQGFGWGCRTGAKGAPSRVIRVRHQVPLSRKARWALRPTW